MTTYAAAILEAHTYLLDNHADVFVIGQGLWSPWYVGATMDGLDTKYGQDRIIDTPVSEQATTGAAVGAALMGGRPIVVHPRVDFAVLAMDQMVNQAAKWSGMFGDGHGVPALFRTIINRGGSQGAQHSQSLHSWFAHIPGLRVIMPATAADARDLLIAGVLSNDPVVYLDDRWCYEAEEELPPVTELDLASIKPAALRDGEDITIVANGFSTQLALQAAKLADEEGISASVIDLRVINPIDFTPVIDDVRRTGRLLAVDGGWASCGMAGEVLASVVEELQPKELMASPTRRTLPFASAPSGQSLEADYYPSAEMVLSDIRRVVS